MPDTLRKQQGPLSIASEVNGRHPLESRIQKWEENQRNIKLESYKRLFGAAEPMRRTLELQVVEQTDFKPAVLGEAASGIHRDILLNKDADIDWEDIYTDFDSQMPRDFHSEMERKVGI